MPCALHRHSSPLPNKPTTHFYTPPPIGSFLCRRIAFFLIPTNSIPPFLWRYKPYTPHAQRCVHPSIMLKMAIWSKLAAKFYQHCATIYTNLYGGTTNFSQPTNFSILVSKNKFSKFFGLFPGAAGAHDHNFRIPLLPLHIHKIFPTFRPHFFHHLTQPLPTFRHILLTQLTLFQIFFKIFI